MADDHEPAEQFVQLIDLVDENIPTPQSKQEAEFVTVE
jgi:hypothetical protein